MAKEISLAIVAYRPDQGLLSRLVLALDAGVRLYIYDNSPEQAMLRQFCLKHEQVTYLTCGKNLGLGLAISSVCAQAYYDGYRALLFFDQDSIFDTSTLEFINRFWVSQRALQTTHAVVSFTSKPAEEAVNAGGFELRDVPLTINSGSLYFLESAKSLGWHDETYFVDGVDYAFCLQAHILGLRVAECRGAPGFDHVIEQGDIPCTLLGRTRLVRKYAPMRIADSAKANTRLMLAAVRAGEGGFALRFARILLGYLLSQVMVRIPGSTPSALKDKK